MKKILIGIGIILFFLILPFRFINFNSNELSINGVAYDRTLPSIANGNIVSQQFVPQYNNIKSLKIAVREVTCDMSQGYLRACILDSEKNLVLEEKIPLTELPFWGEYPIFTDIELIAGKTYYLNIDIVDAIDDGPGFSFYTTFNAASEEERGQVLTYTGVPIENGSLKVTFEYLKPLHKFDYLAYYFFAIFIVGFFATRINGIKKEK